MAINTEKTEPMPTDKNILDYASNSTGTEKPANTPFEIAVSRAAFVLALTCLTFIAWRVPTDRLIYARIFADFRTNLPPVTMLVLSIPSAVFPAMACLVASAMIAVQWLAGNKIAAAVFYMLIILLCGVCYILYREAIVLPMVSMMQSVSGPPGGR